MSNPSDENSGQNALVVEEDGSLALPERLDLRNAEALLTALRGADGPVCLIGDRVDMLTSPCLQILTAAARDETPAISIERPSAAMLDCLTLLGADLDLLQVSTGASA